MSSKLFYLAVSCVFMFTSCAFHRGQYVSTAMEKPVTYKDIAIGVSQTRKFLGMGGVSKDALLFEARQNMLRNRPIINGEELNNITIDFKTVYYPFGQKTKITMIADVVEVKDSLSQVTFTQHYLDKTAAIKAQKKSNKVASNQATTSIELFKLGDTIITKKHYRATIVSFDGPKNNRVTIQYFTKRGDFKTEQLKTDQIFSLIPEYKGRIIGQSLEGGKIVGFNPQRILIKVEEIYFSTTY